MRFICRGVISEIWAHLHHSRRYVASPGHGSEIGGAVEGGALLEAVHLEVSPEVDDESLQLQALLRLVLRELLLAVFLRGYLPGLRAGCR